MTDDPYYISHGEPRRILGVRCRFVTYEYDVAIAEYLRDTGDVVDECSVCPSYRDNCASINCNGGYWVPDPLFNVLRLRGMPGGDDGS